MCVFLFAFRVHSILLCGLSRLRRNKVTNWIIFVPLFFGFLHYPEILHKLNGFLFHFSRLLIGITYIIMDQISLTYSFNPEIYFGLIFCVGWFVFCLLWQFNFKFCVLKFQAYIRIYLKFIKVMLLHYFTFEIILKILT